MTSSPSEASMWEVREIFTRLKLHALLSDGVMLEFALALDRHAVAQREKDAKIVETFPYHEWHREHRARDLAPQVAAAIRSAK